MSKILLDDGVVWNKDRLPTEKEAMRLLGYYVHDEINPEAAVALSCGIDVIASGKRFVVELTNDQERRICGT